MAAIDPESPRRPSPGNFGPAIVFSGVLLLAMWMLTRQWNASILDRYEFRQLQTAVSIFWMKQEGLRLDYLTPLFGPPWIIPMEFPTYQWCVTLFSNFTGMALDQTGRLVSVLFYVAMLPAIYGLLGLVGLTPSRRLLALGVVLITPVYLFYTRTVMIESTALCLAVWFLYALYRTLTKPQWTWALATCLFAVLAALTKITTFALYALPAAALTIAEIRRRGIGSGKFKLAAASRPALLAALPVGLALGAVLWWIARSDAIKHSNPFTGFLASTELQRWNYGWLGLRFEMSFWMQLTKNVTENILSEGAIALTVLCATFATSQARRVAYVCIAAFFAGPLIFANLYHVHDYYYTANALLLTGVTGLLLASAWDNPRLTAASRWALLLVLFLVQYRAFDRGYHYYYWKEAPQPPALAEIVREITPEDGVILIYGWDWNPLIPYYAQRRTIMVPDGREDDFSVLETILEKLPPRQVVAMLIKHDPRRPHHEPFIDNRARRFGFLPTAFATSEHGELYLQETAVSHASNQLREIPLGDVILNIRPPTSPDEDKLPLNKIKPEEFTMTSPRPTAARSRFGISVAGDGDRRIINAHPDSELIFTPPKGATEIYAEFGIAEAAYASDAKAVTDGVVVEIHEQRPDGFRRLLYQRRLNPAAVATDRGLQVIKLDGIGPFNGTTIFKITPGPDNNPVNDWSYWGRIEIR
ncbi:ArnT family glycosyltransferase [Oleiharenicola lentus]|uniref:ArnT family glycosyltransferase n=1 Tax=Oleiharenicola lentus TaxID=2508720 RepID=UPI003F66656F